MTFSKFEKDARLDITQETDSWNYTEQTEQPIRDKGSWGREADQMVKKFFSDRDIEIAPEIMDRILLLNKRRKEFQDDSNQVYGGETTDTHLDEVLDIVNLVPENLKLAAIVHDVGKTGPWKYNEDNEEMSELNGIVMSLFAAVHDFRVKESSIIDLLKLLYINDEEKIARAMKVLSENGINPEMKLNDFYPMHVQWSDEVLNNEQGIPLRDKFIALNHHRLLKGIEIAVAGFEPTPEDYDRAAQLEVADYFVAAMRRRGKKLPEVKSEIRVVFSGKIEGPKLEAILEQLS